MTEFTPTLRSHAETRLIWALCLASMVIYINLYTLQGMLPSIAEHFDVSGAQATLVLSVTSFTLAFSLLFYALLSDRIGRLVPIVMSLWLLAASNILLVFAQSFDALVWVRLLQGILLAAVPAISMAYFKEQLDPVFMLKAAAVYIMANSIGGIAGRLLGGLMAQYLSWQSSMGLIFIVTLMGVAFVTYLLPRREIKPSVIKEKINWRRKAKQDFNGFMFHLSDTQMRLAYIIGGLAFMMMVNQFSFIQLHIMAEPYGLSRFQATLIFLCYLSGTFAAWLSAKWIVRYGSMPLFRVALCLMVAGTLLTLVDTLTAIVAGFLITACGFFLTHSCCNSFVAIRATSHRAKATSLYLCCYYLGASLGGPYLMLFWHKAEWNGVVVGSMSLLVLLLVTIWRLGKHQKQVIDVSKAD
ncbi:MFS transporter [Shewanella sp. Actino-trap-3]|jgi:YNFM family putative membrane transporter|uniref:MFS transporter n=1 Tax=Shewanella sp. Actino-trap-3 TaxID=2058331 RepID=UPI000C32B734|nr:MFS transporter [Shewanella sp. Actino-trap-3]PKG76894.1 MFS transporter [Shewanella sp. Actino-trap-3]|tara:strand:- start:800 stop:2035 length:1236 start_codon:yes stop_codon:yes gene_type:complete